MSPWFGRRRRLPHPPPWWPAGEPWPPRSPAYYYRERRARFIRRSSWWSFVPVWILAWLLLSNLHRYARGGPSGGIPVLLLLLGGLAAGAVALTLRYIAAPLADVSAAANRIKARDYRVRVPLPQRGPAWIADTVRAFNAMAVELEAQDRVRRNLMADIAHELRTPLAVLQGQIEGLIDGVYPRDAARLEKLLAETRMLGRLVEDLRTLATAESGTLALAPEPTDLVALANDVAASFQSTANESAVALEVSADGEIPLLDVDPLRIREVLMNLVSNALRHTPRGGRVDLEISASSRGVDICVRDTGTGMTADEVGRVFDRFFKGAGSTGSGLGLTIARRLVEAHGGTIRADSLPGQGTTMSVCLPRGGADWIRAESDRREQKS
jgi:two-component system OmpR family sensor kinase/two-component system sensor histidine kinase BaeS